MSSPWSRSSISAARWRGRSPYGSSASREAVHRDPAELDHQQRRPPLGDARGGGARVSICFAMRQKLPDTNPWCQPNDLLGSCDRAASQRAPSARMILAVLSLGGISYALLQSLVVPALPQIQDSLHTSESAVGWVLTAFLLSASVTTPIVGRLGDMYGKERLLMIVLVLLARRHARSRPSPPRSWLMLARPRHPGRRRRHLPARLLDHPRRVPARAGARRDRARLVPARDRRRRRRGLRRASSPRTSPTTGCSGSRSR